MLIALDWDGTYTADPALWNAFIDAARSRMHEVWIVTARHESEPVQPGTHVDRVVYTGRQAKRHFVSTKTGRTVQVWIDDMPEFILTGAAPKSLEENSRSGLWLGFDTPASEG
jgi:hypothetical protein